MSGGGGGGKPRPSRDGMGSGGGKGAFGMFEDGFEEGVGGGGDEDDGWIFA